METMKEQFAKLRMFFKITMIFGVFISVLIPQFVTYSKEMKESNSEMMIWYYIILIILFID